MISMTRHLFIVLFCVVWGCCDAQNFKLRFVSTDQGLQNPYIYSISQDKAGFLWIATSEGVARYDGADIQTFLQNGADNFITATYVDAKNDLWIGHSRGGITLFRKGKFHPVYLGEEGSAIAAICQDSSGYTWFASKASGLIRVSPDLTLKKYNYISAGESVNAVYVEDNLVYIGTDNGLKIFHFNAKHDLVKNSAPAWLSNEKVNSISGSENGILIGTENSAYMLAVKRIKGKLPLQKLDGNIIANVQHIFEDHKKNIWISTFDQGLYKLTYNKINGFNIKNFNETNGLMTNSIRSSFEDREGNIWIGTYGIGLACIVEEKFSYYDLANKELKNNIYSIFIKDKHKWLGLENGLLHIDPSTKEEFLGVSSGLPNDKVTACCYNNNLFIVGTETNGSYMRTKNNKFKKLNLDNNDLFNSVNAIVSNGLKTWIATKGGLLQVDNNGRFEKVYTTNEGLPHNNVNHLYLDSKGLLWMGFPVGRIARLSNGLLESFDVSESETILNITCITEDLQGNIWLGTNGNGIFKFNKSGKSISATEGLKSNYCYLLTCDESGNIWVGHRGGVSIINTTDQSVIKFDKRTGFDGDCNLNAVATDEFQSIWLGTNTGVIRYDPDRDLKQRTPPVVTITSIKVSDKDMDPAQASLDLPFKNYKIKIEFKAVSLKHSDEISYLYKLEGHDNEWIETQLNQAFFSGLEPGKYKFLVKARKDKHLESLPVELAFVIDTPLWKKPWFITITILFTTLAIYYVVKRREQKLKEFQNYLKNMLDEKTLEVRTQKEELARKNKDITDSINYARRIQDAILPDPEHVQKAFAESFIFYQPRDIVSGDFYWFDQIDNKYVVVCADATGHGVPGAFITMIGSTLIRDIYAKHTNADPSEVLELIHLEFKTVMKQHSRAEKLNDSMDICIAEFDPSTCVLKIASAMRPVFLYNNNELIQIKGDRALNTKDYNFETKQFKLAKGDCIYLFTDGFTDQFGGPKGKKIKTSGLRELITGIAEKPMEEQHIIVRTHFDQWKKELDQLDDVLLIGLRV
jgi:ligand-binding sensor domain-containing protein/serine phosphatase RsbU (regulator of sigma subunit)